MADLCPILGAEETEKLLLPIYTHLLVDSNTKVRLNIVSNFDKIKSVGGGGCVEEKVMAPQLLVSNLLPTLIALKSDSDWRVRQVLLQFIPHLSAQLGREIVYKELRPIILE